MALILTRPPAYSTWNPGELAGPHEWLTLREWEVAVATCALEKPALTLLREALLEPATSACAKQQRWPVQRCVRLCDQAALRRTAVDTLRDSVLNEVVALWQVLDLDPGVIPGMLRGLLLVGLGARLRQTLVALEKQAEGLPAEQELKRALSLLGVQGEQGAARQATLVQQRRAVWWRKRA